MSSGQLITSWKETIGMLDSLFEFSEPDSRVTWVDRYGRMKRGRQHVFAIETSNPNIIHENVVITEAEVGVQTQGYDSLTDKFNNIDYLPAYRFTRAAGGLAIASVIISRDGQLTIPLTQDFKNILQPQDVIDDIHLIMCRDEEA